MVSPQLALSTYLACLLAGQTAGARASPFVRQDIDFVSAEVGDTLSLPCFFKGQDLAWLYWYKQTLGERPRMISSFYMYDGKESFYDEFKDERFSLDRGSGTLHLNVSNVRISDSGTYYCASSNHYQIEFAGGIFINVKGSSADVQASVYQSGSSQTLECTVHAGSCNEEHTVYWFRNPKESNPGIIYANGGRSNQCKSNSKTQTHSCVLPLRGLNHSHTGTFYCAVASCGHILFGNGTKVDSGPQEHDPILLYLLSGACAITTIASLLLLLSIYKMKTQSSCHCTESPMRCAAETEVNEEAAEPHYAALNADLARTSRREVSQTTSECVYSGVRHHR